MPRATQNDLSIPSVDDIRAKVSSTFGVRPCLWQIDVIQSILQRKRDVVIVAGTGMGKTLTFLAPVVFRPAGAIQLIVTPLNILGEQQVVSLKKANLNAIFIGADSATKQNFQDIENGKYQCVVITPEQLVKVDGGFFRLSKTTGFLDRLVSVVFDEAHCASTWADFRPEYKRVGFLRNMLKDVPFVAASATMPPDIKKGVFEALEIRTEGLVTICMSTDRPNVRLHMREIQHPLNSFRDLEFVLGHWKPGNPPPDKFLVFFDDIFESIRACVHIREILAKMGPEYRHKVVWFNSDMSDDFKRKTVERFKKGELWGLFTTESFGLVGGQLTTSVHNLIPSKGIDLPDIRLIVQWRRIGLLSVLWQRFGRGARNQLLWATAVYLVESEYLDEERQRKEEQKEAKAQAENKKKQKREEKEEKKAKSQADIPPAKRVRTSTNLPPPNPPKEPKVFMDLKTLSDPDLADRYTVVVGEKLAKREAGCAMDDFVNAHARNLGCRRRVLKSYFGTFEPASNHMECDATQPMGCVRCRPAEVQGQDAHVQVEGMVDVAVDEDVSSTSRHTGHICCDVHQTGEGVFEAFAAPERGETVRQVARSSLNHPQPMKPEELNQFAVELETFLIATTVTRYGNAVAADHGRTLIMDSEVFDRIILCIRHHKAPRNVKDLWKETRWDEVVSCGSQVIALIDKHFPQIVTAPEPSHPVLTQGGEANAQKARPPNKCSICKSVGHNKRRCPSASSNPAEPLDDASKENIPTGITLD